MLATLLVLLRSLMLTCCGHRAVALDNMALRQQLAALTRTRKRPQLRTRDRPIARAAAKTVIVMLAQAGELFSVHHPVLGVTS